MKCKICQSNDTTLIEDFTPYVDKDWKFPIYDCNNCFTRFAIRANDINYHNLLHEAKDQNNYNAHYELAQMVSVSIDTNKINECERALRKNNHMHGQVLDYIARNNIKTPRVLELGCSSGYFTAFLNAKGVEAYGSDISIAAISKAKDIFPNYSAVFSQMPQHDQYDIIFHKGVISCVDNPVEFLESNLKMLKPNGRLIFNMSSVNSTRKLNEIWASTPPPDVIYLFHEKAMKYFIKDTKQYQLTIDKHVNYFMLFKKHLSLSKGNSFNSYPRKFSIEKQASKKNLIVSIAVLVVSTFVRLLVIVKLLKTIDEDFGTVVKIEKVQ
ncbi:MAG: class I SAM-dependent methyltransferase [Fulvivirga sp.]